MPDTRAEQTVPRSLQFALFAIGLLWLLAARVGAESAAAGFARLLHTDVFGPALSAAFLLILLVTGFTALSWLGTRDGSVRGTNALPTRASAPREWQKGVALGWALLLVALLPMVLGGALRPQFWLAPRAFGLASVSILALLLGSLASEICFRGFLFRKLIAALGPVAATILLSGVYALMGTSQRSTTPFSFFVTFVAGLLFSLAYLRTHALWLGWGLHFGWLVCMVVFFGLPLAGVADLSNVVVTNVAGSLWLTGGSYGPEGALFTGIVLLAGTLALYSLTRDYAWVYTHPPIVAGGYPMDVPPPAAHAAMEAPAGVTLVQIAPVLQAVPLPSRPGAQLASVPTTLPASLPDSQSVGAEHGVATTVDAADSSGH